MSIYLKEMAETFGNCYNMDKSAEDKRRPKYVE